MMMKMMMILSLVQASSAISLFPYNLNVSTVIATFTNDKTDLKDTERFCLRLLN